MGEVINLRQYRKQKARAEADTAAADNRVQFGRKKAEREQKSALDQLIKRRLDGARIRPGAFSSEVDTGPRQENATKPETRADSRYNRSGTRSGEDEKKP